MYNPDRWLEERDKSGALVGVYANLWVFQDENDQDIPELGTNHSPGPPGYRSPQASRTASGGGLRAFTLLSKPSPGLVENVSAG